MGVRKQKAASKPKRKRKWVGSNNNKTKRDTTLKGKRKKEKEQSRNGMEPMRKGTMKMTTNTTADDVRHAVALGMGLLLVVIGASYGISRYVRRTQTTKQ